MELSDEQRRCLQAICDHFLQTGRWPKFRQLHRMLVRENPPVDLQRVLATLPPGLASRGPLLGDNDVIVLIRGLMLCARTEEVLAQFVRVVRFCADRYRDTVVDDAPRISSVDLQSELEMDDVSVRQMHQLLLLEPHIRGSGAGGDADWNYEISDDIYRFGAVESVQDYLAVQDQLAAEAAEAVPWVFPDPQATAALAATASTTEPQGGLRAFLMADIRGFTTFTQVHGDEAAAALVQKYRGVIQEVASDRSGEVLTPRGDETCVVFGSARQALRAAVDLQRRFREETERDPALPLVAGIGLDIGEPVPVEDNYIGEALNLAARLCSAAEEGEVLASEGLVHAARKMVGLRYSPHESVELKGFDEPVHSFRVVPDTPRHDGGPPPA